MTIHDIAKMAGVSVATVSRVINNKGYVKEETRRRVEQVIQEQGYRPNAVARSLINSDSSMIAVIMAERPYAFSSKVLEAIEERAAAQGDSVLFYGTGAEPEKELKAISQAMEHRVKGILLLPVMDSGDAMIRMIREAESGNIPVVLLNWNLYREEVDSVLIDNKKVIYDGVRLLLEEGHREIGFIACPEVVLEGGQRRDGYTQCLRDFKIPLNEDYIYEGEFDEQSGYDACGRFLSLPKPPTAILASCSSDILGCVRYCRENGLGLGTDLGLVGFDDISLVESLGYPVTVLEHPARELGQSACDLLYMRAAGRGGSKIHRSIILGTRTIRRGSERLGRAAGEQAYTERKRGAQ